MFTRELVAGPYPEPDESSPRYSVPFLLRSNLICSHPRLGLRNSLSSLQKLSTHFSIMYATCSTNLIILYCIIIIIFREEYTL
jgi:hypothetical protein